MTLKKKSGSDAANFYIKASFFFIWWLFRVKKKKITKWIQFVKYILGVFTNLWILSYMSNCISSGMGMATDGIPTTDNIPERTEIFGCPTDPTTDFLKHLILSYSFEIKQINERTNIYSKFYFSFIFRLETRIFRLSRVYCQLWVSQPYPYPRKFSCSCMNTINNNNH